MKTYRCAVGCHLQRNPATFHQWIVLAAVMTYGEVVTDGDVIVLQVLMEHVVHISETAVGILVFLEMSHYDAFQTLKDAAYLKVVEHTVHLRH